MAYLIRHYFFTLIVLRNDTTHENKPRRQVSFQPKVTILIPACDEEKVIGRILGIMVELTYPVDRLQIIVIDDGSRDNTYRIALQYSRKYNHIKVLHRTPEEGRKGKASALNFGQKWAEGEIILCFDADYCPQQKDIVEQLVKEFADPRVGGVQGRILVMNESKNIVTKLVALERVGGYRVDQEARHSLGLITQFGGTVGGFRKSLLESLGGWDESMYAEDTDLTFRAYLAGYRISYVKNVKCSEEAVENWRAYWRQRYRWSRGHMQCAFKHQLSVLRSRNFRLREKIDALLLLNVYFVPVVVLFSWVVSVPLFFLKPPQWFHVTWAIMPFSAYSFVGNFAPFFEVGIGTYLDGRRRGHWLISLLILNFLYNMIICTKALADVLLSGFLGRKKVHWDKTVHHGNVDSQTVNSYFQKSVWFPNSLRKMKNSVAVLNVFGMLKGSQLLQKFRVFGHVFCKKRFNIVQFARRLHSVRVVCFDLI